MKSRVQATVGGHQIGIELARELHEGRVVQGKAMTRCEFGRADQQPGDLVEFDARLQQTLRGGHESRQCERTTAERVHQL